jgi:hypothetical protein
MMSISSNRHHVLDTGKALIRRYRCNVARHRRPGMEALSAGTSSTREQRRLPGTARAPLTVAFAAARVSGADLDATLNAPGAPQRAGILRAKRSTDERYER